MNENDDAEIGPCTDLCGNGELRKWKFLESTDGLKAAVSRIQLSLVLKDEENVL